MPPSETLVLIIPPFFFSSFLLNPHLLLEIINSGCLWLFCYPLHFSPAERESKGSLFWQDKKVVRVKLWHLCKVLCLHISSESLFPRFQGRLGGWFKVFRILFIYLPYIVWRLMLKGLPYCSELCSVHFWKLVYFSLIVPNLWRLWHDFPLVWWLLICFCCFKKLLFSINYSSN